MDIYLINMPFSQQEYTKFTEKWDYIEDEYLGINVIHSLLLECNCGVTRDNGTMLQQSCDNIIAGNFPCVMISTMQTSARITLEFIVNLRKKGYLGDIFIGGWFAKLSWIYILDNDWPIDYVCYVDGENVIPEWLENKHQNIVGIATKDNYKEQQTLKPRDIRNAQTWPARYITPTREANRNTYRIETSRGCPHANCSFCSLACANVVRDMWKPLPVEIILNEIKTLHKKYGATRFSMTDDDMLGPLPQAEKRAKELRDAFCSLPFKINFSTSLSVKECCNGNNLDYLLESGLEQLGIGFESADKEQLKRYSKQQSLEDNFIAAKEIRNRNIHLIPGLITFDPFATRDTVRKNLDFLFDHLSHYDLNKLTKRLHVITGTPIAKLVEDNGLLIGDYLNFDYNFMHEEATVLYENFQTYTKMAGETHAKVKKAGKIYEPSIGEHHKKVAIAILDNDASWQSFALEQLNEIKIKLGSEK